METELGGYLLSLCELRLPDYLGTVSTWLAWDVVSLRQNYCGSGGQGSPSGATPDQTSTSSTRSKAQINPGIRPRPRQGWPTQPAPLPFRKMPCAPLVRNLVTPRGAARPLAPSASLLTTWLIGGRASQQPQQQRNPLKQQARAASILTSLAPNPGAVKNKKRVGRGPSSGRGKTSGRGHNGQKQHGKVKPWFQGGQTPLIVQHGRKGFDNLRRPVMSEVNLDQLQRWIHKGRIDARKRITPKELIDSGLVGTIKDGIKILARKRTALRQPINLVASRASAAAIAAVEAAGGKIMTRYYTKLSLRRLVRGQSVHSDKSLPVGEEHVEPVLAKARKGPFRHRLPDPTSREDIEYYRDPAHRGYLSHLLAPGESPSLYWKVPGEYKIKSEPKAGKEAEAERLW